MKNLQILQDEILSLPLEILKRPNKIAHLIKSLIMLTALFLVSCAKDDVDPNNKEPEIIDNVSIELPADPGEVGLVISAREVFRKGYMATEAKVTFPDYPEFDETVEIDPITNVAILKFPNEDLTAEQKSAFANGITVGIVVYDKDQTMLEEYTNDSQQLDATNTPVTIPSHLEFNLPSVHLKEGVPYYLQPERVTGDGNFPGGSVLQSETSRLYTFSRPDPDPNQVSNNFRYFFKPVGDGSDAYHIMGMAEGSNVPDFYFGFEAPALIIRAAEEGDALKFNMEQDDEGWVKIKEVETGRYIVITEGSSSAEDTRKALRLAESSDSRFRFISANIEWSATDRGTRFSESIMPPAEIDFAYAATIKNCSEGLLTEEVGLNKERTSTRSLQTTESLQFFAGAEFTAGMKTGVSAGASVPGVGDVSASVEVSASLALTTNVTTSNENTVSDQNSVTSSVSRIRTLQIPPFTGVEIYDAVRVVKNAKVPFTQIIRLTAKYKNGPALTGGEISTQMLFNFVTAVPIKVGADYVDVGLSGFVNINEMFETETGVQEIVDVCN